MRVKYVYLKMNTEERMHQSFVIYHQSTNNSGRLTGSGCSFDQSHHEKSSRMEPAEGNWRGLFPIAPSLFVATLALSLS
uniref:Uncharacterized protein n=1 Tax=Seriola lalandi dorsalis TaxID=1841481 RepID=A0A3B4X655_SERLL